MSKQIFLTGIVSEWMSEDIRFFLQNTSEKDIDIYISSYGGSVNKGFEIANLIQGMQGKNIHTHILSHADSIATVIFLAAKKENRHVVDSSTLFIHEPRFIVFDEVTKDDAEKMSAELEIQKQRIADYYVKNIENLEKEEALALMAGEVTLTPQKMQEYGIVNEVLPAFEIAAQRNLINNKNNMSLFTKDKKDQEPLNTLALNDGTMIAFNGELKEGTEVTKVGEIVDLSGEVEDTDGRKITLEANKVTKIEEAVPTADPKAVTEETLVALFAEFESRMEKVMDDKIEAFRKKGSTAKIPKVETSQQNSIEIGTQASARANISKLSKEIQAEKRKRQEA